MASSHTPDVNVNVAALSETALNIEDVSNIEVLSNGTSVTFAQKTQTPFMVLSGNKDFYALPGASCDAATGFFIPIDTLTRVYKSVINLGHTGIVTSAVGSMNATTKDKFDLAAFAGVYKGIAFTKIAQEDLEFSAANEINNGTAANALWGAWLIQITAAGVVSTKPAGGFADQVFTTSAETLDRLPAPDAGNLAIGHVIIQMDASQAWVCNTTNFDSATTTSVTWVAYTTPGGPHTKMGPQQLGPPTKTRIGGLWTFDAPANNTIISIAEVW